MPSIFQSGLDRFILPDGALEDRYVVAPECARGVTCVFLPSLNKDFLVCQALFWAPRRKGQAAGVALPFRLGTVRVLSEGKAGREGAGVRKRWWAAGAGSAGARRRLGPLPVPGRVGGGTAFLSSRRCSPALPLVPGRFRFPLPLNSEFCFCLGGSLAPPPLSGVTSAVPGKAMGSRVGGLMMG